MLLLSGDHVYKMDYGDLMEFHGDHRRLPSPWPRPWCPRRALDQFGILEVDEDWRVVGFEEKPPNPKTIPGDPEHCLVNMGIYLVDTQCLVKELCHDSRRADSKHDFGKDIIPRLVQQGEVFAYPFRDPETLEPLYWRDIGTLDSFYQAAMDLLSRRPPLDLYDRDWPFRAWQPPVPPAKTVHSFDENEPQPGILANSIVGGRVHHLRRPGAQVHPAPRRQGELLRPGGRLHPHGWRAGGPVRRTAWRDLRQGRGDSRGPSKIGLDLEEGPQAVQGHQETASWSSRRRWICSTRPWVDAAGSCTHIDSRGAGRTVGPRCFTGERAMAEEKKTRDRDGDPRDPVSLTDSEVEVSLICLRYFRGDWDMYLDYLQGQRVTADQRRRDLPLVERLRDQDRRTEYLTVFLEDEVVALAQRLGFDQLLKIWERCLELDPESEPFPEYRTQPEPLEAVDAEDAPPTMH